MSKIYVASWTYGRNTIDNVESIVSDPDDGYLTLYDDADAVIAEFGRGAWDFWLVIEDDDEEE